MSKILLETNNLKKSFNHADGKITLFENFNIKIKEGELVALVGPSGSGKSSLLHLLALLDDPTKGEIILNKQETQHLSNYQKDELRRSSVSIIFQDNNLLTDFTAIENVMMPLIIKGENTKEIFKKAEQILKNVKIFNRSQHFPNQLSGGEQQRIAIARAMVNEPSIILADEPTGNLDPDISIEIFKLFEEMNKKGATIIFATHSQEIVRLGNHRVINLKRGKVVNTL